MMATTCAASDTDEFSKNHEVCILKLHLGQRRVTLAEAETLLASQKKTDMGP